MPVGKVSVGKERFNVAANSDMDMLGFDCESGGRPFAGGFEFGRSGPTDPACIFPAKSKVNSLGSNKRMPPALMLRPTLDFYMRIRSAIQIPNSENQPEKEPKQTAML